MTSRCQGRRELSGKRPGKMSPVYRRSRHGHPRCGSPPRDIIAQTQTLAASGADGTAGPMKVIRDAQQPFAVYRVGAYEARLAKDAMRRTRMSIGPVRLDFLRRYADRAVLHGSV